MFERYTDNARRAIFFARYEASQFGSPEIGVEHLFFGLMRADKGAIVRWLGERADELRDEMELRLNKGEVTPTNVDLPLSKEASCVLTYAAEEAERLGQRFTGTEHLLLGMLREPETWVGSMLRERGAEINKIRVELTGHGLDPHFISTGASPNQVHLLRVIDEDDKLVANIERQYRVPVIGESLLFQTPDGGERRYRIVDIEWRVKPVEREHRLVAADWRPENDEGPLTRFTEILLKVRKEPV